MKDEVHAADGPLRKRHVGEIALEKLDARDVIEIAALACNQTVRDANAVAAADELFGEVRSDETGTAGDEVLSHTVKLSN